jgi:hypothetical protein
MVPDIALTSGSTEKIINPIFLNKCLIYHSLSELLA